MEQLDIGMASTGNRNCFSSRWPRLQKHSVTDWRLFLIVNPHPRHDMRELVCGIADRDARIVPVWLESNIGYAGAVNEFLRLAATKIMAYLDDDSTIMTPGWDDAMCRIFDMHHEVGLLFPNGGAYPIDRGSYTEVMWSPGFCWMTNRLCYAEVGGMDQTLGHQEEADLALKVRLLLMP